MKALTGFITVISIPLGFVLTAIVAPMLHVSLADNSSYALVLICVATMFGLGISFVRAVER